MEGNEAGGLSSASYYHHHHHHLHNNNHNGNGIFSNNPEALRYPSSDPTPPIFSHSLGPTSGPEPAPRRKRGRPRKYGPGGSASGDPSHKRASSASSSLPLSSSPSSAPPHLHKKDHSLTSSSSKKAQLVALGNAGQGFTPHVIMAAAGEDVAQKIMSFMQQGKRAVCIISASGSISNASLRQPAMLGGNVTYEGRFEILSLSGSFLHTEVGGASSRTGGLSICLSGSDGRIVGGGVGGFLKAAGPVQVIAGSFVYDGKKKVTAPPRDEAPTPLVGLAVSPVRFRSTQDSSARISSRIRDGHQDIEASSFMIQPRGMHGISPRSTDWRVSHIEHDGRVFAGQADGGAYQSPEEGDDDDHIGD